MLEFLADIDRSLFLFLNGTLSNPVTDFCMPLITSDWLLRVFYVVVMAALLWKGSPRLRWLVLASAVALVMSDQLSSNFLKPLIGRLRPCQVLSEVNLLVACGGGRAMPSSHATNAFAQAALFSLLVRGTGRYLWVLASIIAVSRVFVGVHYPFDVIVGAAVGSAVGVAVAFGFEAGSQLIQKKKDTTGDKPRVIRDRSGQR